MNIESQRVFFLLRGLLGLSTIDLKAQTDPAITIGKKERLFSKVLNVKNVSVGLSAPFLHNLGYLPVLYYWTRFPFEQCRGTGDTFRII